jgi:hypothetical protein
MLGPARCFACHRVDKGGPDSPLTPGGLLSNQPSCLALTGRSPRLCRRVVDRRPGRPAVGGSDSGRSHKGAIRSVTSESFLGLRPPGGDNVCTVGPRSRFQPQRDSRPVFIEFRNGSSRYLSHPFLTIHSAHLMPFPIHSTRQSGRRRWRARCVDVPLHSSGPPPL